MDIQSVIVYVIVGVAIVAWGATIAKALLRINRGESCDKSDCDGCDKGCNK